MGGANSKTKAQKKKAAQGAIVTVRRRMSRLEHDRATRIQHAVSIGPNFKGGDMFTAILNIIQSNDVQGLLSYNMRNSRALGINDPLDDLKTSQLHLAAWYGMPEIARAILNFHEVDINVINIEGDTPLISAIKGAEKDYICAAIVSVFVRDKRCQIARSNFSEYTALESAVVKGFRESTRLLVAGDLIKAYSQQDLAKAIKSAISLKKEDLAEEIFSQMNRETRLAFQAYCRSVRELEPICQFLDDDGSQSESESHGSGMNSPGYDIPEPDYLTPPPQQSPFTVTRVETLPEELGKKITLDARNREVHIGSLVQIMSEEVIWRENPRIREEVEFIERIAHQKAYVHDIDEDGDIYVDVLDSNQAGQIGPKCVQLVDQGPRSIIATGVSVAVGYYVEIIRDEEELKDLAKGHGGWKPRMLDTCGRTGKIRKIERSGDVFVHFSWGERFCFNPKALLPSSAADVEAKDINGDWLRKGNLARVTDSLADFRYFQEEIGYAYDSKIMGKLVAIRKLRLFLQHCDVIVIEGKQTYNLNPKCLTLVNSGAADCNGNEVKVGDWVTVRVDREEVKALQTTAYGNWTDQMESLLGCSGRILEIEVADGDALTVPVARVKFNDGGSFYLNPKSLRRSTEESMGGKSRGRDDDSGFHTTGGSVRSQAEASEGLQVIPRSELAMIKKLGEGGFGVVTTGSWKGTDCAIKQIRTVVTNQIDYEDILKEARIQFNFKHPNIVQLYGISFDGDLWMVMQLIHGTDLHTLLFDPKHTAKEKMSMSTKLKIAMQATNAIAYLHGKGYLHNDIKPENMIIEKRTKNLFICDFGITRYLGQMDLRSYNTKYTSSFGGTLPYISPECFQKDPSGKRYVSPTFKSDVWSLGAVLLELFLEREVFADEESVYMCKLMGDYRVIKTAVKSLPPRVLPILRDALDASPDKRPTAQEMLDLFFEASK